MYCLANLLFFDIPGLYYYTNLKSSIICYLSSGDIYLSFGISISPLASLFCECSSLEEFCKYVLFHPVFLASVADFLAVSRSF